MATSDDGYSPVTFHRNKGENVELTKRNTVATRTKSSDYGIVFTSKPMVAGQMLKVTVTEREGVLGGMVRAHLVCALLGCLHFHKCLIYSHNTRCS